MFEKQVFVLREGGECFCTPLWVVSGLEDHRPFWTSASRVFISGQQTYGERHWNILTNVFVSWLSAQPWPSPETLPEI